MKKLLKVVVCLGAVVGGVAGVLYFLDKKKELEFEDFDDDDFDDVFKDDSDDRDYVTLDLDDEDSAK